MLRRIVVLRIWSLCLGQGPPVRLWLVEKPIWIFGRTTAALWRWGLRVWAGLLGFFNREFVALLLLLTYAALGAGWIRQWPAAYQWLGLHRAVDTVILGLFLFWGLMLAAFAHERLQEQLLRYLPAFPIWFPLLVVSFALLVVVTALMLVGSLLLLPLAFALMVLGLVCSWWRARHGIRVRCTKGECRSGRRYFSDLQIRYVCPGHCGAQYGFLIPSHLGLFYHHCSCGARLPALASLRERRLADGRTIEDTLEKVCPSGHPWGITADPLPSRFVAVVGGSSAGKTCFMTMALESLVHGHHGRRGLAVRLESEYDAAEHRARAAMLAEGKKLPPTQRGVPDALVARFDEFQKRQSRLYLYDAAGEEYAGMERESAQELVFFHDLTGLILLVDPLSLPRLGDQGRAGDGAQWDACQVSQVPLRVIVSSLSRNVRRFLRCGRSGRRDIPVAVVVNKVDFPIVSARIGAEAIRQASPASSCVAEDDSEHRLCREALMEWGAENEVVALESDFPRIRYFSCSSLGRPPDESGRPFVADRVLSPLFWLLDGK